MDKTLILLAMIFMHIVDDYYLQCIGILSKLKQKKFWEENAPQALYKYDYIVGLFMHSFSWVFMIMLPIVFYNGWKIDALIIYFFFVNLLVHGVVDHIKCNLGKINLIQDQFIHIVQILITFIIFVV